MGIPPWDTRLYDFRSYLDDIRQLALSQLAEYDPDASEEDQTRWKSICSEWKDTVKSELETLIRNERSWRRIVFLLENCKLGIEDGNAIIDPHNPSEVAEAMAASTIKKDVENDFGSTVPPWVDNLHVPVAITYNRRLKLTARLGSMSARFCERWELQYDNEMITKWEDAIVHAMTPHLYINLEWEKILFMLDEMMESFDRGEELLDATGQVCKYYSGSEMLRSLEKPESRRFKGFQATRDGVLRRRIPASIKKTTPINGRVARIHGIRTVVRGGSHHFRKV